MEVRERFVYGRRLAKVCSVVLLVVLISISSLGLAAEVPTVYPQARFAVISDLHVFDPSLGSEGPLFQEYINSDRKLLVESLEILETTVSLLKDEDLDFVIVAGDLTKDGERLNHERAISLLSELLQRGMGVYVVPGNHDLMNGHAVMFKGDTAEPVPTVTPVEFAEMYSQMGYSDAIRRDPASLSYVVEPLPGLWIVAMDACRYKDNRPDRSPVTDGRFSEETLRWLDDIMNEAEASGKALIGVMHHGIIEHYQGQQKYYGEYLVDDWPMIGERLAAGGMKVVFTGHYHSQDIVKKTYATKIGGERRTVFMFDIETGSLVTYPCPYRIIEITEDQVMSVRSHVIESIPSRPDDFRSYARDYVHQGISGIAARTLMKYWVREESAEIIAPQVADAVVAHYRGDEVPPEVLMNTEGVGLWTKLIVWLQRGLVRGLWNDLEPPDNDVDLDLKTGQWSGPSL